MKIALLIIDMQKGYFQSGEEREALPTLTDSINELITIFQDANQPVIQILTTHKADKSTWTRKMKEDDSPFCVEGSEEAEPVAGLRVEEQQIITKTRDNAFLDTDLHQTLQHFGVERVVLAGVSTHECVAATGIEASERDYLVVLAKDAVHSPKSGYANTITKLLGEEYGAEVLSNTVIKQLLLK